MCDALAAAGAGNPGEWLNPQGTSDLLAHFGVGDAVAARDELLLRGTANGMFGVKFGCYQPHFDAVVDAFRGLPGCAQVNRAEVWQSLFPNGRHIFMTRRNKVRLAVSWWKLIQSGVGHRMAGEASGGVDVSDKYSFEAIENLVFQCVLREALIDEFFREAGIVPLTVTYEDFELDYTGTVRDVLDHLGLDSDVEIAPPAREKLADEISEGWVQRFRKEKQVRERPW